MKRSGTGADGYDGVRKRGRKELRNIRRAGGRKPRDAQENGNGISVSENTGEVEEEPSSAANGDDVGDEVGDEASDDEEEMKKQVYGALLTILKSEHPEPKKQKKEKVNKVLLDNEQQDESDASEEEEDETQQIENALMGSHADDASEDDDKEHGDDNEESDEEQDPFETHFNSVDEKFTDKLDVSFKNNDIKYKSTKLPISEDEYAIFSKPVIKSDEIESPVELSVNKSSIHSYFLKQRLKMQNNLMDPKVDPLTPLQKQLVDPMFQYKDILYQYDSYGKDEDEYRDLYSLHVLNHLYKTRDKILKNNQRLQDNNDTECLDQGFTRPKVLIVVPTRDTAYQVIEKIIAKSGIDQVDKKGKFKDQFFEDSLPPSSKPKSFQDIFKGNTNDFFVLGVKFTRKAIKLYSNFYQSDIIICSPLGIQMILENTDKKKRQDDFLSSIELMIIDQLHSIEYQNISHLFTICNHINKIPQEQHDADFSRVRMWYINDQAKLFRQTMLFTKYISPMANSLLNGKCQNWSGRWKNHKVISTNSSSISKVGIKIRQIFQRFETVNGSVVDEPDYRFKFFTSVTVPNIVKTTGYEDGTLIYIPEYTDYIRVRNYLKDKTTILFGDINEYSDQKQLNSNRSLFQQGRVKVLLYTERLHHYRRYEIKGVKNVVFYQPPKNPEFYTEVVRYIGKNAFLGNTDLNISTVRCLYSKLDALSLENIVGSKRAGVLCHAQNEVYEFK
ncbi:hypothetical protein KAFR_0J01340 [Kazachstania africana CBS 2517]|uniref:U3 small nucleolar RNA-associated protein 25 n=1 Tax=Kazachstania africana (strain ATCC 22294 / BCRC 22015 / CBS 2517 / CECT 1963 / NBRC 1671 / NRRL Y-8276) TaxID=1071382 RepID=H2B0Q1_KAZAF|nr:hypothetical protein KAFR_0J01340 [Kazachstania africana CBS 2517]CCF60201.1 hypothetical protein KAFR_0J01340 [Kazachstania africana CBS 2517]